MSALVLVPGMLVALGLVLAVSAFRPTYLRLDDALAALSLRAAPVEPESTDAVPGERLGAWWLTRRPAALSATTQRALTLKGRSIARHYSLKVLGAAVGFALPVLASLVTMRTGVTPAVPLLFSIVGAVVGFIAPDVVLRGQGAELASDATESLLTFFDLVTLERLANQSATQSLHAAAGVSDSAVFVEIRSALERARLEQQLPYAELKAVGERLALPALVDLADVMRLDESGAALSGTLRARVKELRDAHLTALKVSANSVSERMTIFMVFPSLIFGLLFLVPPLLKLISG